MDFTREPIVETVITPKEGFKLVVRSSKNLGQEEYFVDALEVVSFGHAFFLRSTEKPKAFLVPASDYEVLEVREARIVLKNVGTDRSIKIGGGREAPVKSQKETHEHREPREREPREKEPREREATHSSETPQATEETSGAEGSESTAKAEGGRGKRDRRRHYRRRRGRDEEGREQQAPTTADPQTPEEQEIGEDREGKLLIPPPAIGIEENAEVIKTSSPILSSLLTPPPQLISETIERYKSNALFKDAFYERGTEELMDMPDVPDEEAPAEVSTVAWEFSQDVEAPQTSFNDESLVNPKVDEEVAEPLELPPDPQSHRE